MKGMSGGIKFSRYAFAVLAWLFAACVVIQTFIAGSAVFGNAAQWDNHVMFVHLFEYLPLLMLIVAFTGKMPAAMKWWSAAALLLIFAQYATANVPGAGALHPVIALVLFGASLYAAVRGTKQTRRMHSQGR